jgi:hypothetical protein
MQSKPAQEADERTLAKRNSKRGVLLLALGFILFMCGSVYVALTYTPPDVQDNFRDAVRLGLMVPALLLTIAGIGLCVKAGNSLGKIGPAMTGNSQVRPAWQYLHKRGKR